MTPVEPGTTMTGTGELPTELAYAATLPEMRALGEQNLAPINVDVVGAVTTVLGVLPELRALRADIREHLPTFDLERFDKLEQYTLALNHSNAIHRGTLGHRGSLADLGSEVTDLRDRLLDDAESLANHGLLNRERLAECKRSPSYRSIATDVFTLVSLFKEHWPKIENRTPVTAALLQQAGTRALDLLAAVGVKEQAPVAVGDAQLARQQAYTLFVRAYVDARRAVAYLRAAHGDADEIAPSFFLARGNRSSAAPSSQAEPPDATSNAPAPAAPAAIPSATNAPAIQIHNPDNLPIDSPFVS